MAYTIEFQNNPSATDIRILIDGIVAHAKEKKDMRQLDFFAFFIRDEEDKIMGGCNGFHMYGSLFVSTLWVTEQLRGQGYGTKLMQQVEALGYQYQCNFLAVNTMDWEALDFYKKLGFFVEFERTGFDKNSTLYLLRKNLK